MKRKKTKTVRLGPFEIGGGAPVTVQSMTNTDTRDAKATSKQIAKLVKAGCDIVRVAVPDAKAVSALPEIIEKSPIPVIADIHFNYKLALGAINAGVHALRLNPGNIGNVKKVKEIASAAKKAGIPIRVGANSGSLTKDIWRKHMKKAKNHDEALVGALVESALKQCEILENCEFRNIKVSLKSSSVPVTVKAYRKFAKLADYPLHLGITEAGTMLRGTVKSAVGIGALLLDGIGDTIRVSLTADPVEEVKVGIMILESLGLRISQPEIVSCPTCGRTEIDIFALTEKVEKLVDELKGQGKTVKLRKIAVMGCVVNGPGEARDADLGITGGKGKIIIFKNGQPAGTYPEAKGFKIFRDEILKASK